MGAPNGDAPIPNCIKGVGMVRLGRRAQLGQKHLWPDCKWGTPFPAAQAACRPGFDFSLSLSLSPSSTSMISHFQNSRQPCYTHTKNAHYPFTCSLYPVNMFRSLSPFSPFSFFFPFPFFPSFFFLSFFFLSPFFLQISKESKIRINSNEI